MKCTEGTKVYLPFDMNAMLRRDANEAGCELSEFIRDIIYMHKEGVTFGEHVANHRRAVLAKLEKPKAQGRVYEMGNSK